jgi:hypothetical protein
VVVLSAGEALDSDVEFEALSQGSWRQTSMFRLLYTDPPVSIISAARAAEAQIRKVGETRYGKGEIQIAKDHVHIRYKKFLGKKQEAALSLGDIEKTEFPNKELPIEIVGPGFFWNQGARKGGAMNHNCIKCGFDKHPFVPDPDLFCDACMQHSVSSEWTPA